MSYASQNLRFALPLALVIGVVDQINKWWMLTVFDVDTKGRVAVAPFFDVVYVLNRGISYGLFTQDSPEGQWVLAGIAVLISIGMVVWLAFTEHTRLSLIGVACVVGGALSNAIDRVHLGGVADFYLLHGFGYSWYVFNIADVAIVLGVVVLLFDAFVANRGNASNRTQ